MITLREDTGGLPVQLVLPGILDRDPARTAYHEAGHVIGHCAAGSEIVSASIIPIGHSLGRVMVRHIADPSRPTDHLIVALLAGPAAECWACKINDAPYRDDWRAEADLGQATRLAERLTGGLRGPAVRHVERLRPVTRALIRRSGPSLAAVAGLLLARQHVTGAEIMAVLGGQAPLPLFPDLAECGQR